MGITQKTEAVGMFSAEGEYVEFGHSVLLEGPVEVLCLTTLEYTTLISVMMIMMMFKTTVKSDNEYFKSKLFKLLR